jgi:1-phosphatidylinositol phosphodiesterase
VVNDEILCLNKFPNTGHGTTIMTTELSSRLLPRESETNDSPTLLISDTENSTLTLNNLTTSPTINIETFSGITADSKLWLHCECTDLDGQPYIIKLAEAVKVKLTYNPTIFSCELPLNELSTLEDNSSIKIFLSASFNGSLENSSNLRAFYQLVFQHIQNPTNLARWMTSVPGIEHLKLDELILLSAHNAGVDKKNAGWPATQWAVCQDDSFAYQLNNGARVLDLRLFRNIKEIGTHKEFIFKHNGYHSSRYLNDCLQAVRAFAQQYPEEFVILDFNEVEASGAEHQINSAIIDIIGDRRLPAKAKNLTIGQIRNQYPGQNVITAWDNNLSYTSWPKIARRWIGEDLVNESDLYAYIRETMQAPPSGHLWSMQAVGYNLLGPIRFDSDRTFWRMFFDTTFFNSYRKGSTPIKGNIINVDFLVGTGAAQKCINATRSRAAAASRSAPRNVQAEALASIIVLTWERPEDTEEVIDYSIFHSGKKVSTTKELAEYLFYLKPDTTYNLEVVANFASGSGAITDCTIRTTPPAPNAPKKPTNLRALNITHNAATVTWNNAPANENVIGYIIWTNDGTPITITENSHIFTGLINNYYTIEVAAFNNLNQVSSLASVYFTVEPLAPPPAPQNFRGTPLPGRIKFDWDPAPRAVKYSVRSLLTTPRDTTETSLTSEFPVHPIDYIVVAIGEDGASSTASNIIRISPAPAPAVPEKPTHFTGSPSYQSVNFTWSAVLGAAKYELYRQFTATPITTTTNRNFHLTGIEPGTRRYHLIAVGHKGEKSEQSEYVYVGPR